MKAKTYVLDNIKANEAYKTHYKLIHWIAYKYKGKLWDDAEVYSIVLEAVMRAADRFEPGKGSFANFAMHIASRDLRAALKIHHYHTDNNISYDISDWDITSDENEQEINNTNIDLTKLLDTLPTKYKDIIIARRIKGLSLRELAITYNVSKQRIAEIEEIAMGRLVRLLDNGEIKLE